MWVRDASWDAFWVLSGVPIGLVLLLLWRIEPALPLALLATALLSNGHVLSPIATAWLHPGFRTHMRKRPAKYIALPTILVLAATATGAVTAMLRPQLAQALGADAQVADYFSADIRQPFIMLALVYVLWNAWHFGMQNFGVLSIYRHKIAGGSRRIDMVYACGATWTTMAVPFIPPLAKELHSLTGWPAHPHPFLDQVHAAYVVAAFFVTFSMLAYEARRVSAPRIVFIATLGFGMIATFWLGFWALAIVSINHWLVAIGLASHVRSRRGSGDLMALGLILGGAALFCALFLSWPSMTVEITAWALGLRMGLGFVHFLYDRWIYKLGDPAVCATIGTDLLRTWSNNAAAPPYPRHCERSQAISAARDPGGEIATAAQGASR